MRHEFLYITQPGDLHLDSRIEVTAFYWTLSTGNVCVYFKDLPVSFIGTIKNADQLYKNMENAAKQHLANLKQQAA